MSCKYIDEVFTLKYESIKNLKIPIQLYKYTIEKIILEYKGKCIIFSSTHPVTKEKIAIKCIPISRVHEDSKEDELMKRINHPNIIKFIDSFYYPNQNQRFFSIVMPRAVSDLLYYLLLNEPLEEEFICKIMKQALNAVSYLHKNQIWHRDLKPDNILIMEETVNGVKVAITDFGLSDIILTKTFKGRCLGTLQYAAPELVKYEDGKLSFKEEGEYSNKIDTWSMGATLYVLISSVIPFDPGIEEDIDNLFKGEPAFEPSEDDDDDDDDENENSNESENANENGNGNENKENPLARFRYISEECKDLIRQMLRADPDKRLTIDGALRHPWFNIVNDENNGSIQYHEIKELFDVLDNENESNPLD